MQIFQLFTFLGGFFLFAPFFSSAAFFRRSRLFSFGRTVGRIYREVGQKSETLFTGVFQVADSEFEVVFAKKKMAEPLGWVDFFKFHIISQKMILLNIFGAADNKSLHDPAENNFFLCFRGR